MCDMEITKTEKRRYWQQVTTGTIHKRQTCGISRRTRYDHAEVFLTDEELAKRPRCEKCQP